MQLIMGESCTGPECAFRYTYVLPAWAGMLLVKPVFGTGMEVGLLLGVFTAFLLVMTVAQVYTRPVVRWWKWLAVTSVGAFVIAFGGTALAFLYLPGVWRFVGSLAAIVVAFNYVPRLTSRTPLAHGDDVGWTVDH
jgi:hypothetical protein